MAVQALGEFVWSGGYVLMMLLTSVAKSKGDTGEMPTPWGHSVTAELMGSVFTLLFQDGNTGKIPAKKFSWMAFLRFWTRTGDIATNLYLRTVPHF